MKEENKTKAQLLAEVAGLRKQLAHFETAGIKRGTARRVPKHPVPAVAASEKIYRLLFNNISDAIFVHEGPGRDGLPGRFLEVNDVACTRLGYTREELLKKRPSDIDVPETVAHVPAMMKRLLRQKSAIWEGVHRTKDGRLIPVEISNHLFDLDGKRAILSTVRDISERKKAEEAGKKADLALRESEQRVKMLAEATSEGIAITEHGKIVDLNDQHAKMHGYERSELIGRRIQSIVAPESREHHAKSLRREDEGPVEYVDLRKDGSKLPVEVRTRNVRMGGREVRLTAVRDISERKKAEEHIHRLSRVVEQTADSVVITDCHGVIEYVNPAYEKLSGYAREEVVGKTPRIVRSGYHDALYYKDLWKTILGGKVFRSLITNRKKNGELSYEEITITPIKDDRGRITNFVSTNKDVTARRLTEMALMESEHRFKILADASFEGIMLTERGVVVDCNDQLCKMLGHDRTELLWKPGSLMVAPESRDFVNEAIRSGRQDPYEHLAIRKDGSKFPVEVRGRSTQSGVSELRLTVVRDITKQKQTEETLEHERNLLRILIDNLPDLFYFKDAQGRYVLNNPAHMRSIGVERQEDVAGKTTFDFHPRELAARYFDDEMEVVRTGKAMIGKEELCYRKDTGAMHWHLTSKIPLKDHTNTVSGFVCISHDITEQKRVQEAFQRERNFLRTLVDNLPDIVYFKDTEGRYVLNNIAHLRSIGARRQEDVLGKTTFDFNPRDLAGRYHDDEMEIVRTGKGVLAKEEIALHRDSGEERWHLTSKIPLIDERGKVTGIVGISHDITEQKQYEEKIRHERNLLRTLIDTMPELVNYKDTEGRYLLNNRAHLASLGAQSQEEVLGKTMFDFHPSDLAKTYLEHELAVLRTGEPVLDKEEIVLHRDRDEMRWHLTSKVPLKDQDGKVTSYITISSDITERKRSEEALQNERNLLRTLIDNLPVLIFSKDIEGRYLLNNLPHLRSLGAKRQEEVLGKTSFDFNPPELAKKYFEDEIEVVKSGKALYDREELALHRDSNEKRWHLTSKIPLVDARGKVTGMVGIASDITERKRAEAERERLIKDLQDALADIKTLSGLVPICANCKKIRDDKGYWTQVEAYIQERSQARFSHGICPDCMQKLYPEFLPKPDDEGTSDGEEDPL